jgi:hypothetical protein
VDPAHIPLDDPALHPLVRANRRALQTIIEQPRLVIDYIASFSGARQHSSAECSGERAPSSAGGKGDDAGARRDQVVQLKLDWSNVGHCDLVARFS